MRVCCAFLQLERGGGLRLFFFSLLSLDFSDDDAGATQRSDAVKTGPYDPHKKKWKKGGSNMVNVPITVVVIPSI